jgi:hypothetical protein
MPHDETQTPPDPASPQGTAAAHLALVRDALYVLGSPATLDQLCELVDLPADVIRRRLNANGPGSFRTEWKRFEYDRAQKLWSLTRIGEREAEAAANKK